MRLASIDIGTNTLRLLICEFESGDLTKLHIERVITRLGGEFTEKKKEITEQAAERTLSALRRFRKILRDYRVENVKAVATSVVRESRNGNSFIKRVKDETGIQAEVVTGAEEARLTAMGVLKSVPVNSEFSVLLDIGGGSTEYVYLRGDQVLDVTSTRLGVVRLTEKYLKSGIPSDLDIQYISDEIRNVLLTKLPDVDFPVEGLSLIATAGTPTTLAAMQLRLDNYNADLVNDFSLSKSMIQKTLQELIDISPEQRLLMKGLEKGREDLIIPGSLILLSTLDKFCCDRVTVSEGGLLEGIAYSIQA